MLVAVASPRHRLDDNYLEFFNQVARQIAMAIAIARSYEEERRRAEQLAELDRAKTVFFSNVSHEFRTPLTLMLGPTEDALSDPDEPLSANQQARIETVQRNGLRLLKLVNTLLDVSRIEAGRVEATYEPTDLAAFTAELASVFRACIEQANLRLVVDCPPLPEAVYVDREMWEKIVLNLLSNAFKFTFKGEISVNLQWQSNRVQLAVRDTGIGIPAAELPHLFERFHRVKGAQGRSIEGSGIGLSLVQELVQLHGGTVEVKSVLGEGSCFTVSIPTGSSHLPQDHVSATRTLASTAIGAATYVEEAIRWLPKQEGERGRQGIGEKYFQDSPTPSISHSPTPASARILLADDNSDMRNYVKRLLSQQYEVETVADGVAALAAIAQALPDLVLTDVMMPNLDGFGLLRELRANPTTREIPIILLSARAGEESRVEGLQAGADDYLTKPFSARELLARVEATLKLARVRKEAQKTQREQQLFLQNLTNTVPVLLWTALPDGTIDFVSQPWIDYTGMDLVSATQDEWLDLIHSDDRNATLEHWTHALQTSQSPYEMTHRVRRADGEYRWCITRAVLTFDEQGAPLKWFGSTVDIEVQKQTEAALQESEDRLRMALEASKLGMWHWDLSSDTLTWTKQCKALFGLPANTEMSYSVFLEAVHPDDRQHTHAAVTQAIDNRVDYDIEYRSLWLDGTVRWIAAKGSCTYDSTGQATRMLGVAIDITARKRTEEALRESEERLKVAQLAAKAGTWDWDVAADRVYWSEEYYILYGLDPATPSTYENWLTTVLEEDRESANRAVREALEQ